MITDKIKTSKPQEKSHRARKSEVTRGQFLEASVEFFGEQGYFATTLRQIAKRAKIDAGSIYYYSDCNDKILDEVMEIDIRAVADAVKKAVDALPETKPNRKKL